MSARSPLRLVHAESRGVAYCRYVRLLLDHSAVSVIDTTLAPGAKCRLGKAWGPRITRGRDRREARDSQSELKAMQVQCVACSVASGPHALRGRAVMNGGRQRRPA